MGFKLKGDMKAMEGKGKGKAMGKSGGKKSSK